MELSRTIETETGEMIVKRVSVPLGLEELMEGLAKEVILKKPKDIYVFASEYFARLLHLRDSGQYRGNVKSAKLAVKQPSRAVMIGHNIFSSVDSDQCSKKNIERKPSTPYYLNPCSKSADQIDEKRRSRIREHLRMKKEEWSDNGTNTQLHFNGNEEKSVKRNKKDVKIIKKSRSATKNKRKDSKEERKPEKKSYENDDSLEEIKKISKENEDTQISKNKKHDIDSNPIKTHSVDVDTVSTEIKTPSSSLIVANEEEIPRTVQKLNTSSIKVEQNASISEMNSEYIGQVTPSLENVIVGPENSHIKTGIISSTQDMKGQYEVSYNPDLLASDREGRAESTSSLNGIEDSVNLKESITENSKINANDEVERTTPYAEEKNVSYDLKTNINSENKEDVIPEIERNSALAKKSSELEAAILIQNLWRGFQSKKKNNESHSHLSSNDDDLSLNVQEYISNNNEINGEKKYNSIIEEPLQESKEQPEKLKMESSKEISEEVEAKRYTEFHKSNPKTPNDSAENNQKNTIIQNEMKYHDSKKLNGDDRFKEKCPSVEVGHLTSEHEPVKSGNDEQVLNSETNPLKNETERELLMNECSEQVENFKNEPTPENITVEIGEGDSTYLDKSSEIDVEKSNSDTSRQTDENEKHKEVDQKISSPIDEKFEEKIPKILTDSKDSVDNSRRCTSMANESNSTEIVDKSFLKKNEDYSNSKTANSNMHELITKDHLRSSNKIESDGDHIESPPVNEVFHLEQADNQNNTKAEDLKSEMESHVIIENNNIDDQKSSNWKEKEQTSLTSLSSPQEYNEYIFKQEDKLEKSSENGKTDNCSVPINTITEKEDISPKNINSDEVIEEPDIIKSEEHETVENPIGITETIVSDLMNVEMKNGNNDFDEEKENAPDTWTSQKDNQIDAVEEGSGDFKESKITLTPKKDEKLITTSNSEYLESKKEIDNEGEESPIRNEIHKKVDINSIPKIETHNNKNNENRLKISDNENFNEKDVISISEELVEPIEHGIKKLQILKSQEKSIDKDIIESEVSLKDDQKHLQNKVIKKRSYFHSQMTKQGEKMKNNKANISRVKSQETNNLPNRNKEIKNSISPEKKIPQKLSNNSRLKKTSPRKPTEPIFIQKKIGEIELNHVDKENLVDHASVAIPLTNTKIILETTQKEDKSEPYFGSIEDEHKKIAAEESLNIQEIKDNTVKNYNSEVADRTSESSISTDIQPVYSILTSEEDQLNRKTNSKVEDVSPKIIQEPIEKEEIEFNGAIEIQQENHENLKIVLENNARKQDEADMKESDVSTINSDIKDANALESIAEKYTYDEDVDVKKSDNTRESEPSTNQNNNVDSVDFDHVVESSVITQQKNNEKNDKLDLVTETEDERLTHNAGKLNDDDSLTLSRESCTEKDVSKLNDELANNEIICSLPSDKKPTDLEVFDELLRRENNDINQSSVINEKSVKMEDSKTLGAKKCDVQHLSETLCSSELVKIHEDVEKLEDGAVMKQALKENENKEKLNLSDSPQVVEESLDEAKSILEKKDSDQLVEVTHLEELGKSIVHEDKIEKSMLKANDNNYDMEPKLMNDSIDTLKSEDKKNVNHSLIPENSANIQEAEKVLLASVNSEEFHEEKSNSFKSDENEQPSATKIFTSLDHIDSNGPNNESKQSIPQKDPDSEKFDKTQYATSKQMECSDENIKQTTDEENKELSLKQFQDAQKLSNVGESVEDALQNREETSLREFMNNEREDIIYPQKSDTTSTADNLGMPKHTESAEQESFEKSLITEKIDTSMKLDDSTISNVTTNIEEQSLQEIENSEDINAAHLVFPSTSSETLCAKNNCEEEQKEIDPQVSTEDNVKSSIGYQYAHVQSDSEKVVEDKSAKSTNSMLLENDENDHEQESENSENQMSSNGLSNTDDIENKVPKLDDEKNSLQDEEPRETELSQHTSDHFINDVREIESAINIQKIWRGFQARKELTQSNIFHRKKSYGSINYQVPSSEMSKTDENKNLINSQNKNLQVTEKTPMKLNKPNSSVDYNDTIRVGGKLRSSEEAEISSNDEKCISESATRAALKIQSSFRRFKSRKGKYFQRPPLPNMDSDAGSEYVNQVLKIQSAWRAYKVRKNIRDVEEKINEIEHHSGNKVPKSIHLTDEEILKAVTKIQTSLRGYMARKHFKNLLEQNQSLDGIQEESNLNTSNLTQNMNISSDEQILNTLKKLDDVNVPCSSPEICAYHKKEEHKDDAECSDKNIDANQNITRVNSTISSKNIENSSILSNDGNVGVFNQTSYINPDKNLNEVMNFSGDKYNENTENLAIIKSSTKTNTDQNECSERDEIDTEKLNEVISETIPTTPFQMNKLDRDTQDELEIPVGQNKISSSDSLPGSLKKSKATDDLVKLAEEFENDKELIKLYNNTTETLKISDEQNMTTVSDTKDNLLSDEKLASFEIPDSDLDLEDPLKISLDNESSTCYSKQQDDTENVNDHQPNILTTCGNEDKLIFETNTANENAESTKIVLVPPHTSPNRTNSNQENEIVNAKVENDLKAVSSKNTDSDNSEKTERDVQNFLLNEDKDTEEEAVFDEKNLENKINEANDETSIDESENILKMRNSQMENLDEIQNKKQTDDNLEQNSLLNENARTIEDNTSNTVNKQSSLQLGVGIKKNEIPKSRSEERNTIDKSDSSMQTLKAASVDDNFLHENQIETTMETEAHNDDHKNNSTIEERNFIHTKEKFKESSFDNKECIPLPVEEKLKYEISPENLLVTTEKESEKQNEIIVNVNQQQKRLTLTDFMKKTLNFDENPNAEDINNESISQTKGQIAKNHLSESDSSPKIFDKNNISTKSRYEAAVKIQSLYRGYNIRKKTEPLKKKSSQSIEMDTEFPIEKSETNTEEQQSIENKISPEQVSQITKNVAMDDQSKSENSIRKLTPEESSSVAVGIQTNVASVTGINDSNANGMKENVPGQVFVIIQVLDS